MDGAGEAGFKEVLPQRERDVLAMGGGQVGWVEGGVLEVKRAEEAGGGVEEVDDGGPGNIPRSVWYDVGKEENSVAVVDGAGGVGRICVPLRPPAG